MVPLFLVFLLILSFKPQKGFGMHAREQESEETLTEESDDERLRRQTIQHNPDGSITASFAASEAFDIPGGGGGAFDIAQTFNIGPKGATFGGGQSFSSDVGGNKMSFGQSNSQSSLFGPNGFSSSGGNSASNSFSNPFFSSSNAQANAFANDFRQGMPFHFRRHIA